MIGILVITHGQLAHELVAVTRAIVGDIPRLAAVSIGWSDDMAAANTAIQQALQEVGGEPALILTDMFGGTPTNVSLAFLSPRVEIVTGVNLPMLIKLTTLQGGDLVEIARVARDQGKGAIYVASELLEKKPS
jgi:PTS system mannose-specific IIA component